MRNSIRLLLAAVLLCVSAGTASALYFTDTQHQNIWFKNFGVSWMNIQGDNTDLQETAAAPVPEPASLLLLGGGLIGLAGISRRQHLKA